MSSLTLLLNGKRNQGASTGRRSRRRGLARRGNWSRRHLQGWPKPIRGPPLWKVSPSILRPDGQKNHCLSPYSSILNIGLIDGTIIPSDEVQKTVQPNDSRT